MYHIVYLTTNLINNKMYVGVHSTYNLDDGYLGSGNLLIKAIKKYGKENFKRTILHYCLEAKHAYELEAKIVDDIFIKANKTYNCALGGFGGDVTQMKNKTLIQLYGDEKAKTMKENLSIINSGENNYMHGKKHSIESINKMKHVGDENPNSYHYLINTLNLSKEEAILKAKEKHGKYKGSSHKMSKEYLKNVLNMNDDDIIQFYKTKNEKTQRTIKAKNIKRKKYFHFEIITNNGELILTENILEFCKCNNLSYEIIRKFINKGIITDCSILTYLRPSREKLIGWEFKKIKH